MYICQMKVTSYIKQFVVLLWKWISSDKLKLISSTKILFYIELSNIKQKLIINNFPNHIIDEQIKLALNNFIKNNANSNNDIKKIKTSWIYLILTWCTLYISKMKKPLRKCNF